MTQHKDGVRDRPGRRTIVVDFDGTITEEDLLGAAARAFGGTAAYEELDVRLDRGAVTLHEVLAREFEPVRAPLADVVDWTRARARVRPGFRGLVELARERGWRLVVVSSGFRELIEPVLAREGLADLELLANRVEADPAGWRVAFRDERSCDRCGEACKRATVAALADGGDVVYVGDGRSDRCAAEAADVVFARRSLADHLAARGVPFIPFDDFHAVADRLS